MPIKNKLTFLPIPLSAVLILFWIHHRRYSFHHPFQFAFFSCPWSLSRIPQAACPVPHDYHRKVLSLQSRSRAIPRRSSSFSYISPGAFYYAWNILFWGKRTVYHTEKWLFFLKNTVYLKKSWSKVGHSQKKLKKVRILGLFENYRLFPLNNLFLLLLYLVINYANSCAFLSLLSVLFCFTKTFLLKFYSNNICI